MNIILFDESELTTPLSIHDPRGRHIRKVLRGKIGDLLQVGIINGLMGTAEITGMDTHTYTLRFQWLKPSPPLYPVQLLIGHPRPQIMRRILRDAAQMGVMSLHFPRTELGEKSYLESHIWENDNVLHHIREGVEQSGSTRFPTVHKHDSLKLCLNVIYPTEHRVAPDNESPEVPIQKYLRTLPESFPEKPTDSMDSIPFLTLAIGPERGWTPRERTLLQRNGFMRVSMGKRILRTDTACVTGLALLLSRLGVLS